MSECWVRMRYRIRTGWSRRRLGGRSRTSVLFGLDVCGKPRLKLFSGFKGKMPRAARHRDVQVTSARFAAEKRAVTNFQNYRAVDTWIAPFSWPVGSDRRSGPRLAATDRIWLG